ncbi:MAG TPA: autotransporter-associated beta strand repeat-containing protein, partial [Candidatus Limnocylindrales bacterium]|nr:autotransporter-associated beta strand repeat-containing protein [Candidatus Limnocylindrales bacterium]
MNIYKTDNADNLNLTTSWTGGATPTLADIAVWDNTVTAANTVLLGVDTNWAGIKILDPAGLVTVSPNVSAAPVTATVNSPTFTYSSAPANPLANGNRAILGGTTAPTGFTLNTVIYFVVNATPTTFQLSATSGGAAISVGATTAGTAVTVTGGPNLTLGASGIDMSLATNSLTLSTPLVLGVNQTWNVTNGLTLTAGGVVSGSSLLTLNNGGNNGGAIILSAANTYTGGTVINSGIAQPNLVNSFGTGVVTNNGGTMLLSTFPNSGILVNALYFTGTSMIDMNNRNISAVLNTAWSGSGTVLITNDTDSGSTFTIGGATGGNMANFSGSVVIVSTNAAGTGSAGTVRLNNGGSDVNFGSVNLSLDLGTGATVLLDRNRAGNTLNIGALSGGVSGQSVPSIKIGSSGTGGTTYSVGGKNLNTTFAGIFDGTGATTSMFLALTKVGTGIFTLAGNNTYNGVTTISGGILRIGDGATSGYGTLGTGNVTDNATLAFARPDAISIANIISGSGNLVQGGGNTLTLNSANTYGGATIVTNGGTIIVGTAGAVPANTALTLGGAGTAGTLDMFGNNVQVNSLNTGSGATGSIIGSSGSSNPTLLTVNATNGSSAFSGVIKDTLPSGGSGVVALVVENGKQTLTGANTYSGSTTISNGTVVLGTGGSIASSTIILNGAGTSVLDATAVGGIALSSGYVLAASGGVGGNVTAANCLITPGTNGTVGTLTCSNNLSLNGGGTIHFDLSSSPASGNDQIVVGSALNLSGVNTIEISPLSLLGAGTYKLFVCGSVSATLGNLSLTGSPGSGFTAVLSVTGTEVDLVVTAVAAPFVWRGDGSLNQWDYATANWRSNGVASDFTDGAFAVFDNTGSNTPSIDITAPVSPATVTMNSTINYTLGSVGGSGKLTGLGSLTKTNTSTLTILTANDYTGGTTINQGTLRVSDGSTAGATLGNGNVVNKASLVFNQPDNYDFTNVISGTGNLTQLGSSTLTLSGNNTYSGTTLISAGTLQVGDGNTSGALGTNAVMDNAALAFNRSDSVVQSGLITGTGTLTVVGGTVSVTASNDFSGATTINSGGTLQLGNGGATGSVPLNNVTNNGTLAFNHSTSETNGIVITGSGGISKLAGNTLTLTAANNYNGDTAISAGTLKIGAAGTLPSGSGFGNVVLDGGASTAGTLDLNGFDTILNGINGSSNSVLGMVVNNSGT